MTEKCWIDTQAMMSIMGEANSKYPLETGGMLIGYRKGLDVVVTDIVGPGPGAIHQKYFFEHDNTWQKKQADELFNATEGQLRYIGDWHSHPDGPIETSPLDMQTIKLISDTPEALTPEPLMLIIGGNFSKYAVWELAEGILRSLPVKGFSFDRTVLNEATAS